MFKTEIEHYDKMLVTLEKKKLYYSLVSLIEANHQATFHHLNSVCEYVIEFSKILGFSKKGSELFGELAMLHDIAKISIPNEILDSSNALSSEEKAAVMCHCQEGYDALSLFGTNRCDIAATIALEHHEWYSGNGYPNKLASNEINILARIVSITDVFDALTSDRTYKRTWSFDDAMLYIKNNKGLQFDPDLVKVFVNNADKIKSIYNDIRGI